MRAVKEKGLRVPEDISILGYDDIAAAAYLDPPLTTVAQAKSELGQKAMEMALALLQGQEVVPDVLLQPTLILRSSCAAPGA
jgi:DNA-binding LacI/PurR family transcriptional regulator